MPQISRTSRRISESSILHIRYKVNNITKINHIYIQAVNNWKTKRQNTIYNDSKRKNSKEIRYKPSKKRWEEMVYAENCKMLMVRQ